MKRMDYCVDKFDFLGNREVGPMCWLALCLVRLGLPCP